MRNYVECLAKDLLPGDTFSLDRRPNSKLFVLIEWPKCGQLQVFADRKVYRLEARIIDHFRKSDDLSEIRAAIQDIKAALAGKNKESYTVSEASKLTGLSRETIWRLCRDFHLAFTQRTAKSKIMINGDSLRRYMAENHTQKEAYKLPVNLRTKAGRKVRRMMVGAHPEE